MTVGALYRCGSRYIAWSPHSHLSQSERAILRTQRSNNPPLSSRYFTTRSANRQYATPIRKAATSSNATTATVSKPTQAARPTPSISTPTATSQAATTPTSPGSSIPSRPTAAIPKRSLSAGLADASVPLPDAQETSQVDWSRSFHGLAFEPFSQEASAILMQEIDPADVEVKPDGIVYLPEIKYRRILNKAFGPGGWGLAPRGETIVTDKTVTREYGLVAHGRLTSIARGEQQYFDPEGIPTATEGCKSNALMRCCKDLGIASELWDPVFIRKFMAQHSKQVWVEHVTTKKKKLIVMRKDVKDVPYPWKESKGGM